MGDISPFWRSRSDWKTWSCWGWWHTPMSFGPLEPVANFSQFGEETFRKVCLRIRINLFIRGIREIMSYWQRHPIWVFLMFWMNRQGATHGDIVVSSLIGIHFWVMWVCFLHQIKPITPCLNDYLIWLFSHLWNVKCLNYVPLVFHHWSRRCWLYFHQIPYGVNQVFSVCKLPVSIVEERRDTWFSCMGAIGPVTSCGCHGLCTRQSTRYWYLSFCNKFGERRNVILS